MATKTDRHANKGMKGIRVYYLMSGTNDIYSDIAVKVTKGTVIFPDGGWNPVKDCFLTPGQCRRANKLDVQDKIFAVRRALHRSIDTLIDASEKLSSHLRHIRD